MKRTQSGAGFPVHGSVNATESRRLCTAGIVVLAAGLGVGCGDDEFDGPLDALAADAVAMDATGAGSDAESDAGPRTCTLPFPLPSTNHNTFCGQLVDAETNQPIQAADVASVPGRACDPDDPDASGPCALAVSFYDALSFVQNPAGTPALSTDSLTINNCGRFAGVNMPTPALGFVAVAVDDNSNAVLDSWVVTTSAFPAPPGARRTEQVAFAVSGATDEAWTLTAGSPFGATTFATRGVYFPIFLNSDVPVAGVTITSDGGGGNAYYFDDTDPWTRSSVNETQESTGVNGAGLMADSDLVDHGGAGGIDLPATCSWPEDLAKSIPGVVFASEVHAEVTATGDPCGE